MKSLLAVCLMLLVPLMAVAEPCPYAVLPNTKILPRPRLFSPWHIDQDHFGLTTPRRGGG